MQHKKLLSLLLVLAMMLSLAACTPAATTSVATATPADTTASADTSGEPAATPMPEYYEIQVYSQLANYAGEVTGWFSKVLKDTFNIGMNISASNLEGGESKFATMMAAGDLGEIVAFGDNSDNYRDAIQAGLLLDWTKDDLLATYGKDIVATFPQGIEMNKATFGGGTAVYGLGHDLATTDEGPGEGTAFTWGPYLRWDLYAAQDYPQIKTMEDYLPILQKMKEQNPTTEDGRPTYAFSFWGDWDGSHMTVAKQFACMYGFNDDSGGILLVHANRDEYQDLLDPNGYYMRTLKMYYDANQMGLVDPDSISQKFDDVAKKIENGQVFFSWFSWLTNYNTTANTDAGRGLMLVPFDEEQVASYGMTVYGGNRTIAIGSKAKDPARIMELYNWFYTPEGIMINANGPEGVLWNYENGKTVSTELGNAAYLDGTNTAMPEEWGGGMYSDGNNKINFAFVNTNIINPNTDEPYANVLWASRIASTATPVRILWTEKMGATTDREYLEMHDQVAVRRVLFTGEAPEIMSADLEQKLNNIKPILVQYSWKMVFAKDDAEYTKFHDEMMTKAKGLGYDEVVAWYVTLAEKEFADRKK